MPVKPQETKNTERMRFPQVSMDGNAGESVPGENEIRLKQYEERVCNNTPETEAQSNVKT